MNWISWLILFEKECNVNGFELKGRSMVIFHGEKIEGINAGLEPKLLNLIMSQLRMCGMKNWDVEQG